MRLPDQLPPKKSENLSAPKRNLFSAFKLAFWAFVSGIAVAGGVGSYALFNAEKLNLPITFKVGDSSNQETNSNTGNQPGNDNAGNVGSNSGNQAGAINQGTVGNNSGNQTEQNNSGNSTSNNSGNQTESNSSGIVGNNNIKGNSGVRDIVANGNSKIEIKISPQDPNFQNNNLPGYFPKQGFDVKPPQLNQLGSARVFTQDLVALGKAEFGSSFQPVIQKRIYDKPVFSLTPQYSNSPQDKNTVAFKLDGRQRATLLQFGMHDLSYGNGDLVYRVSIIADQKTLWSGQVTYGTNQQLLSVPLDIPGVTTLVIDYQVAQGQPYNRPLLFTRAELLY